MNELLACFLGYCVLSTLHYYFIMRKLSDITIVLKELKETLK